MKFMNEYDIEFARSRFTRSATPNRLGLVLVIERLAEWTNNNSDGWPYWSKPCQAAQRAIALVESRTSRENDEQERVDITDAELTAAIKPIKAFLTRQNVRQDDRDLILRGGEVLA